MKLQNCWLGFVTYHYSHRVRGLFLCYSSVLVICQLHCQHSSQIQEEFWEETRELRTSKSDFGLWQDNRVHNKANG